MQQQIFLTSLTPAEIKALMREVIAEDRQQAQEAQPPANEPEPIDPEALTSQQVAERLGVSKQTIDARRKAGKLRYRQVGRQIRFVWREVLEDTQPKQYPKRNR